MPVATFMSRWNAAADSEGGDAGILIRSALGMVDFVRFIGDVPLLGYGIGYGGNASIILNAEVDGIKPGWLVEADLSRQMVDLGPIFGLVYIAFRMAFVVWLGFAAMRATRRSADPLPVDPVSVPLVWKGNGTSNTIPRARLCGSARAPCRSCTGANCVSAAARMSSHSARVFERKVPSSASAISARRPVSICKVAKSGRPTAAQKRCQ
jgi:hypothetical protein